MRPISLIRVLQVGLARQPSFYFRLLLALRRGSPEKRICLTLPFMGKTALDLGANKGYFSILLSDLVGACGRVHSFEPVPETFARLSARMTAESWHDNIRLHACAVSDKNGEAIINLPGKDDGQASLTRHQRGSWQSAAQVREFRVRTVRLDDYLAGERVDFVKCDVEGAELAALTGMSNILRRCQPLLLIEVCADWLRDFGHDPTVLHGFLATAGYDRFFLATNPPQIITRPEVAFAGPLAEGAHNVLCVPVSRANWIARHAEYYAAPPALAI